MNKSTLRYADARIKCLVLAVCIAAVSNAQAQQAQPPDCSFQFQNPAGYKFSALSSLERTKTRKWTVGAILLFEKTDNGNPRYQQVFAWSDSKGALISTYALPETGAFSIVAFSDSRATLFSPGSGNGGSVILLRRSRPSGISITTAEGVNSLPFWSDFSQRNLADIWQSGFVRVTQDPGLNFTTVNYFVP